MRKILLWIGGGLCLLGGLLFLVTLAIGGFDFMKLSATEQFEDKIQVLPIEAVHTLRLDAEDQRVLLRPTDDGHITVRYRAFESDRYAFETQDGVCTITYRNEAPWYKNVVTGIFGGIARAGQEIVVEIPTAYAGALDARTTNASLLAENLSGLTACTLNTSNGSLKGTRLSASSLNVGTTNAGILLEEVRTGVLAAKTTNGSLHLEGVEAAGEVIAGTTNAAASFRGVEAASASLSSTNGSLRVENCTIQGTLTAGTTNASVHIADTAAAKAEAAAGGGSLRLEGCTFAQAVAARTANASIRVERLVSPDIRLDSTNGTIGGTIVGDPAAYSVATNTTNSSATPVSVFRQDAAASLSASTTNARIALEFVEP